MCFVCSKRIAVLGLDNSTPPSPKSLRLQQMISAHAGAFLQENLLGLPSLPSEEELSKLREARRQEALRRAEQMRQAAELERKRREEQAASLEEREKSGAGSRRGTRENIATPQPSARFSRKAEDGGVQLSGWKPTEVTPGRNANEDPMIQQMNIIRGYIKQAQEAQKWDEVQMLKENLKELQRVYWEQQQQHQQK